MGWPAATRGEGLERSQETARPPNADRGQSGYLSHLQARPRSKREVGLAMSHATLRMVGPEGRVSTSGNRKNLRRILHRKARRRIL